MKHFRILLPLLILALVLSACRSTAREPYEYTYSSFSGGKTITVDPEAGTITDGQDVYRYSIEELTNSTRYHIDYPNGASYYSTSGGNIGTSGWSEGYDQERYIPGNILVHAIAQNQPREKIGNFGVGFLLIVLGAVNFFFPEVLFHLRKGWMFRDAEPSDAYLILGRISGVIFAILGLIWCVI